MLFRASGRLDAYKKHMTKNRNTKYEISGVLKVQTYTYKPRSPLHIAIKMSVVKPSYSIKKELPGLKTAHDTNL